jgi:hypothetical protein
MKLIESALERIVYVAFFNFGVMISYLVFRVVIELNSCQLVVIKMSNLYSCWSCFFYVVETPHVQQGYLIKFFLVWDGSVQYASVDFLSPSCMMHTICGLKC